MKKTISLLLAILLLTLAGCGGEAEPSDIVPAETAPAASAVLDLQAIYDSMIAVENVPEMLPLEADMQMNFCGIDPNDCVTSLVSICANSLRADEIWLIEAKDADALARIQVAAQTRITAKDEESATYSPEQNAIVKKAVTFSTGNYFMMVVSPDVDTLASLFRSAAGL